MGSVAILWTSSIGFTSETFSQVPSDQLFSVNVHRSLRNHLWIVKVYVSSNHVHFSCRNISSLQRLPYILTEKAYSNDHMPVSSVLIIRYMNVLKHLLETLSQDSHPFAEPRTRFTTNFSTLPSPFSFSENRLKTMTILEPFDHEECENVWLVTGQAHLRTSINNDAQLLQRGAFVSTKATIEAGKHSIARHTRTKGVISSISCAVKSLVN